MPRRINKKRRLKRARHGGAADRRDNRKSVRASLKTTRRMSRGPRKFLSELAERKTAKKHTPIRSARNGAIRNPKTELEAATQRFVDLYDFAPIAYVSFGRAGRIEEANLTATELLGEARDRLIGRPFAFYVVDLDLFMQHLLYCGRSQRQVKTELQLKARKGERIPAQLLSTPITSTISNGALLYQTAIIDLRERKRHEQQLADQARLLDLTNDAIIVRDANDRITYWNAGATKTYGYMPQEALGKVIHNLLKSEHPEALPKIHKKLFRDNYWEGEIVHTSRGGRRLTVFSRWVLDRDAQGNCAYILETNNDITERKRTEKALELASRLPVENPAPIIRLTQGQIVTFANPAAEKLLKSFGVTVGYAAPAGIRQFAAARERAVVEMSFGNLTYQVLVAPVAEADYVNLFFSDITARKRSEQEQQALYQFAQQQNTAKSLSEIYQAALDGIRTTLQCSRASILLFDEKGVMRFVAWHDLSKRYRNAVEGHSPWRADAKNPQPVCISDLDLADLPKKLKAAVRSEGIRAASFIPLIADRKLVGKFMTYYDKPHSFSDSELTLSLTVARQLTLGIEQKRAEQALRKSEEHLRAIINQSNAGIANCDLTGRFIFANRTFREMLGYTDSELATKTIFTITHPDDVGITERRFAKMVQKSEPVEIEKRYIRKDGSLFWVNVCDTPVLNARGKPMSAVAVAIDITERKKAEDALRKSKELLEERVRERTRELRLANKGLQDEIARRKGLEGEILEISDREQQRLGQEIHDGLCQHLTAVAFMARSVALRLKNHRVIDASDIEKIAQLVNDAATDTRNLSRALHRIDVDSAGFVTALEDLVDREIWQIPCRLEVKPSFRIENDVAAGELYRIAREAVINANKHSGAREIVIRLERVGSEMVLRVIDDGVGFLSNSKTKRGLGAHIMGYRSRLMGARLEIDSPKRGGTRVSCYLPDRAIQSKKGKNNRTQPFPARIVKAIAALV
jgi:PAS domain S-box-containing protein